MKVYDFLLYWRDLVELANSLYPGVLPEVVNYNTILNPAAPIFDPFLLGQPPIKDEKGPPTSIQDILNQLQEQINTGGNQDYILLLL